MGGMPLDATPCAGCDDLSDTASGERDFLVITRVSGLTTALFLALFGVQGSRTHYAEGFRVKIAFL